MAELTLSPDAKEPERFGVSAFVLKLLAAATMLMDHVGAYLLTDVDILRVIGRLAFPLYAYFIAEGCRYTRNKPKRFLLVFGLAVLCEAAYFVTSGEITGTALVTFSCSILMIYALQALKAAVAERQGGHVALALLLFAGSIGLTYLVGHFIPMDYGVPGALLPVLLSLLDFVPGKTPAVFRSLDRHAVRVAVFAAGLLMVWWFRRYVTGDIQLYALLAVLPVMLYNGKPGTKKFKYAFYLFYPVHLVVIWLIGLVIRHLS